MATTEDDPTTRTLSKVRRGDVIILPAGTDVWWTKSPQEIEAEYQRNAASGRFLDSAGESILVSSVSHQRLQTPTFALVTKLRDVSWDHWTRRPKRLTEALITNADGTIKYVLFRRPLP